MKTILYGYTRSQDHSPLRGKQPELIGDMADTTGSAAPAGNGGLAPASRVFAASPIPPKEEPPDESDSSPQT